MILRTNDDTLERCLTKTLWLSGELDMTCSDAIAEFMGLINSNNIRLATINLSIEEEIDNLHVCREPDDGFGNIKTIEDFTEDVEMEFMISSAP